MNVARQSHVSVRQVGVRVDDELEKLLAECVDEPMDLVAEAADG